MTIVALGLYASACKNEAAGPPTPGADVVPGAEQAPNPASAAAVEHYICPNGHVGSGGEAQGNCSQCNAVLVHNQAFHANDPGNNPQPNIQSPFNNSDNAIVPPANNTSPAQNAAGIWHYTCANGCAGGAGASGNCASCGNALVHNQAYHN